MPAGEPNRFSSLDVLKAIGRNLLATFLASFADRVAASDLLPLGTDLADPEYFQAIAAFFTSPRLPACITEALTAIHEMTHPDTLNRLLAEFTAAGLTISPGPDPGVQNPGTPPVQNSTTSVPEALAIQAWLSLPALLARLDSYTLEPLRTDGPDALSAAGIPGIRKITLREIEIAWENVQHELAIRRADDVFESSGETAAPGPAIPATGAITHARFDIQFDDSETPRPVDVRPPKTVRFDRPSDTQIIKRWLAQRGFLLATPR